MSHGYNFSERIWSNKEKLINEIHGTLTQNIMLGQDPQKAIDAIAKKMNTSKYNAGRLVMTEEAAFASMAQKECYKELDVEKYEIIETFDAITCEMCGSLDGKVYPMSEYQTGLTAPPFHPNCRGCTAPWFEDDFGVKGQRAARGKDGKTYYVPADMTFEEWKRSFVEGENQVDKSGESDIINLGSGNVSLELQRYGRNKSTLVNKTYINGGEYRNKFDKITDDKEVNRVIYSKAKEMLVHRSGTLLEDMYWIDGTTGEVVAKEITSSVVRAVEYSAATKKTVSSYEKNRIITIHTHPGSMPPSVADFNSCFVNGYKCGCIACHDGKVFVYTSSEEINERLYYMYLQAFLNDGATEYDAQINTLNKLKQNCKIDFWEV